MKGWFDMLGDAVTAAAPFVLRMTPQEFALLLLSAAQLILAISSVSARLSGFRPNAKAGRTTGFQSKSSALREA